MRYHTMKYSQPERLLAPYKVSKTGTAELVIGCDEKKLRALKKRLCSYFRVEYSAKHLLIAPKDGPSRELLLDYSSRS